jgi:capsid protein
MPRTKLKTSTQLLESKSVLFDAYDKPLNITAQYVNNQALHDAVNLPYSQNYRRPIHYYNFARDWDDLVSQMGRNKLSSLARVLYANNGIIKSTVDNIANYVIAWGWDYVPQSSDAEWGKQAKDYLLKISQRLDVRGNAHSFNEMLYQTQIARTLDGDCLWVFVPNENGEPQFQIFPSQRIGNRKNQETVGKTQFRNFRINQGCVLNDVGRTIAYQVLGDREDGKDDVIVPMDACYLVFRGTMNDQYRGVSLLAAVINDLKDYSDIRSNWKQTVHQDSVMNTIIRQKDSIDTMAQKLGDLPVGVDASKKEAIYGRFVDSPEVRVFAPETGEDIELKSPDRPSTQIMDFMNHIMASVINGMSWVPELENLQNLNPAVARMVLSKAQTKVAYDHQEIIHGLWQWAVKKQVAQLMTSKKIPFNDEWYLWTPTPTRKISIDSFKDSKSDLAAIEGGISNYSQVVGQDGNDFKEVAEELARNIKFFQDLSVKYGIPLELLLQRGNKNINPGQAVQQVPQE